MFRKNTVLAVMGGSLALFGGGNGIAAMLTVDNDHAQCPSAQYSSIQAAVTAASPGDTINVCPGVYPEQVTINKRLTVQGISVANQNQAVIMPAAAAANSTSLASGAPIAAIVLVTADNVNLTNLTIDGGNGGITGCAPNYVGVYYRNASGTVDELAVRNIKLSAALQGCQSGLGIFVQSGGPGGKSKVTVSNSSVHDYQKNGITANESGTDVTIKGNAVTGIGSTPDIAQNGIQIAFGAKGTIDSNSVIDHLYAGCTTSSCSYTASNVIVYASDDVKVTRNTTGKSQVNVYYEGNRGDVNNNTIFSSDVYDGVDLVGNNNKAVGNTIFNSADAGVFVDGNGNNVTGNTINEAREGVLMTSSSSGTTVSGNKFYNTELNVFTLPASAAVSFTKRTDSGIIRSVSPFAD